MLKPSGRRATRGIALVEALVAVLIFTTGILGIVGLQAAMTRAQGAAKSRADAALLAGELMGLARLESAAAPASEPANYATNYATDCSGACGVWLAKVAKVLPQGAATLATDAAAGVMTITITWSAPAEGSHRYVSSTSLR